MHSTSLWLAFLASVQQGRALERAFVVLTASEFCALQELEELKNLSVLQNSEVSAFERIVKYC